MNTTYSTPAAVIAVLFATVVLTTSNAGCKAQNDDNDEEASATTTSALQAQSESNVTEGVIDTDETLAPEPEEAAKKVVEYDAKGQGYLKPAGCATRTREGNVVTLTLNKCTGPFGKVVIEGSLIATFSKTSSNILHVDVVAGKGTTANGRAVSYSAEGDIRYEGAQRFVTYHGSSSGTTKRGQPFARHTDLSVVADVSTHCVSIDGASKGTIGKYEVDLTIDGFKGCRDACPTAGTARATVDGPLIKNASVEVSFDGSEEAHVKVDRGEGRKKRELDVTMDCEASEAAE